jgi:chromosome segregation ATPase
LTKYKARCEELERSDRAISPEKQAEIETLREQVRSLTVSQERAANEQQTLQRQFVSLQAQHEQVKSTGESKTAELADEIARLDTRLAKAHDELEETLAINASLNQCVNKRQVE